jgi:hypothetical protein
MKVVQRECFEGNKMSMEEYGEAMNQYENKLSETIEEKVLSNVWVGTYSNVIRMSIAVDTNPFLSYPKL